MKRHCSSAICFRGNCTMEQNCSSENFCEIAIFQVKITSQRAKTCIYEKGREKNREIVKIATLRFILA